MQEQNNICIQLRTEISKLHNSFAKKTYGAARKTFANTITGYPEYHH